MRKSKITLENLNYIDKLNFRKRIKTTLKQGTRLQRLNVLPKKQKVKFINSATFNLPPNQLESPKKLKKKFKGKLKPLIRVKMRRKKKRKRRRKNNRSLDTTPIQI